MFKFIRNVCLVSLMLGSTTTVGNPQINALVVYTSDTRTGAGGTAKIKSTIQSAIDESNTAYAKSKVPQRINLVHTSEVNYSEVDDLSDALDWVKTDVTVANIRKTRGADLVALITEQGGGYCGSASVMRTVSASFESSAYSTTKRSCAVGNLSFSHELGHNMWLHQSEDIFCRIIIC